MIVEVDNKTLDELITSGKRLRRITDNYQRALDATRACPGIPLRDVGYIEIRDKRNRNRVVHSQFVSRSDCRELVYSLDSRFSPSPFSQHFDWNMSPFRPRKGEPSYKEWLICQP